MLKRLFDIVLSLILLIVLAPVLIGLCIYMIAWGERPLFYISERMQAPDRPFKLVKFRTMRTVAVSENTGVSGGDKSDRITPIGHVLRRYRLDELPQLWNILKGDMSFVGPRPPLRLYTEAFPDLYAEVLKVKPGVTGLASCLYYDTEERLLSQAASPQETDEIYRRRCIPRKAHFDLLYRDNAKVCLDIWVLNMTARRVFGRRSR